jgi:hypothetical protein
LFAQSSPVWEPLLQAFPFPSTLGEVTLHQLSLACVFIYSSRGKWVLTPLLWSFPPTATFTSFPAPDCWACTAAPTFLPGLFTVPWGISSPPFFSAQGAPPLCYMSLLLLLLIIQVFFSFFPGWGSVCPGSYADLAQGFLWKYRIQLSSLCGPHFPKSSGCRHLTVARGPSWFLHLMWSGDAVRRQGVVEESKFCFFSVVFPVRCISSVSPRFYFRRHAFCFLPLAAVLEFPLHVTLFSKSHTYKVLWMSAF